MSDQIEQQAIEKRKLIVSTNNLGASNAYRTTEEAPVRRSESDIKAVVKYEPKKETFWSKCKKAVFGTEHIDNIPEYLVLKVFIPAMKQTAYDMFCGGLGMMFGMEGKKGGRRNDYSGFFRSGSSSRDDDDDDYDERCPNSYRDIGFYTEADANDVFEEMLRYVRNKGYVTVLDFYGISDRKSPHSRRDDNKGWDAQDLRGRRFRKIRGKWYIDLPEPTSIDSLVRL